MRSDGVQAQGLWNQLCLASTEIPYCLRRGTYQCGSRPSRTHGRAHRNLRGATEQKQNRTEQKRTEGNRTEASTHTSKQASKPFRSSSIFGKARRVSLQSFHLFGGLESFELSSPSLAQVFFSEHTRAWEGGDSRDFVQAFRTQVSPSTQRCRLRFLRAFPLSQRDSRG